MALFGQDELKGHFNTAKVVTTIFDTLHNAVSPNVHNLFHFQMKHKPLLPQITKCRGELETIGWHAPNIPTGARSEVAATVHSCTLSTYTHMYVHMYIRVGTTNSCLCVNAAQDTRVCCQEQCQVVCKIVLEQVKQHLQISSLACTRRRGHTMQLKLRHKHTGKLALMTSHSHREL